jgi:hypothetical protein
MEEAGVQSASPPPEPIHCPHCGSATPAALTDKPQIAICPQCAQAFVVPALDGSTPVVAQVGVAPAESSFAYDDTAAAPGSSAREDDLDALRIRQIAAIKRTAYRTRSYFLIATVVCMVASARLLWIGYEGWSIPGQRKWAMLEILAATVLFVLARRAFARSVYYKRESEKSALEEPDRPPDLSKLSDGSQRWKNLDNIE